MKILIVSDTHKSHKNLERVIERERPFDMLLHLGDTEGGEDDISALVGCPSHIIRGNNDFFSELPQEEEFDLEGIRIFMTHGHNYYVSLGEEQLKEEARARGANIVMYGHTHKPSLSYEGNLVILNPGSVAYPRQRGRRPSYMVMEVDKDGKVEIFQEYL